ncbi:MAG TPA: L,D-transpeptidase family protein [Thermoleophilaceae bacterium]|nr:L,D-transpeptidase family protein [Thermoleophilaceae bacterium]
MSARPALSLCVVVLAAAPSALAQTPPTPVPPVGPPPPAAGSASFGISGGLATSKARYVAPGQFVVVRGRVRPYVAGEAVTLYVLRGKKQTKRIRRAVRARGRFKFRVQVGGSGTLRLVVKHAATSAQVAFRARDRQIQVVSWHAGEGARGVPVLLLQRALARLHFATPVTGYFDAATSRAVTAYRKTNGMGTTGYASTSVFAKLLRGRGAYQLRYPKAGKRGKHVEFDWSRQVLVLAQRGHPYRIYHSSSGAPATPTVFGKFNFYLQTPGTNAKGMVHSSYFIRGYAIHGYASVPNYPASHGCLWVPIPNSLQIFDWIDIGDPIYVYE